MDLLQPGQIFAKRYRIDRFLAQGGMGAVFIAEQLATELSVAIKVLFPHLFSTKKIVEQFELEARVAARVKSENIVAVFDAGFDEETQLPFLVMEMLSGQSLQEIVTSKGALSSEEVALYFAQCARGLDKAHGYKNKKGQPSPIVHRDLKPENLFLASRDDGEPLIKILDFGIAKVLSTSADLSQEIKGTPLFMAYEQAAGLRITPQTDIWSMGLIAFYLLTGQHYWRASRDEASGISTLIGEILLQPIVRPSKRLAEFGDQLSWRGDFDAWFLRCLNRDPDERFTTAGEAARVLAEVLGVELSPAPPPPDPPPVNNTATPPVESDKGADGRQTTDGIEMLRRSTSQLAIRISSGLLVIAVITVAFYMFIRSGQAADPNSSIKVKQTQDTDEPPKNPRNTVQPPDSSTTPEEEAKKNLGDSVGENTQGTLDKRTHPDLSEVPSNEKSPSKSQQKGKQKQIIRKTRRIITPRDTTKPSPADGQPAKKAQRLDPYEER